MYCFTNHRRHGSMIHIHVMWRSQLHHMERYCHNKLCIRTKLNIQSTNSAFLSSYANIYGATAEHRRQMPSVHSFVRYFDWNQIILFAFDYWVEIAFCALFIPAKKGEQPQPGGWSVKNVQFANLQILWSIHILIVCWELSFLPKIRKQCG